MALSSFLTVALVVILAISVLFFTRNKIGAIIFSAIDLIVGLTLIGSKEIAASFLVLNIPQAFVYYLGIAVTIKGFYYLILSMR